MCWFDIKLSFRYFFQHHHKAIPTGLGRKSILLFLNTQDGADAGDAATQTNSDVAVNPPHGQPGHDCAIPVGAPLNQNN
ncbi:MAG: hypothetical protein U5L96_06615 [Owenweeksia sp.]|nr:hypothetical protein [Owenweeksia sp.]